MKWLLFYRELDLTYYFFNGKDKPVCVMPPDNIDPWPEDLDFSQLPGIIAQPRRRFFSIEHCRYVISARGEFITH